MLTINQMMIFSAVCSEGTLQKAADKLYISQSAVSKAIKDISRLCGLELFVLVGRKLQPTDSALELLKDVNRVLQPYNALQRKLSINASEYYAPRLHVGCSLSLEETILAQVITRFAGEHAEIKVNVSSNHPASLEQALLAGSLDFIITTGKVNNPGIIQEPFVEEIFCWVCSPDHPIARETDVDFPRLAEEALNLPGPTVFDLEDLSAKALRSGIRLIPTYTTTTPHATLNMTKNGHCIALMSYNFALEHVRQGTLQIVSTLPGVTTSRTVGACWLADKKLSEPARAFIALCREAALVRFPYPEAP